MTAALQTREERESRAILSCFERFEQESAGKAPPWIQAVRKAGIAHFAERGFPTLRDEEWRFTNIASIKSLPFKPVSRRPGLEIAAAKLKEFDFGGMPSSRLVFVDGSYCAGLSRLGPGIDGLCAGSLADALTDASGIAQKHLARHASYVDNAFVALNTAFFEDGAFVWIPENKAVDEPIHLLFVSTLREKGATLHPRNLVILEKGSSAKIIENYVAVADAPYFTNAVTELVLGADATLEHCRIQRESEDAFHVSTTQARQDRNSRLISHMISTGGHLVRNQVNALLNAERAECVLNGLFLACDDQFVDHHTVVDHARARCASHEFYHGILGGNSKGVFNGKIFVRRDAQKTDARQTNKNLLLSDNATMNTKPQLEIFADDVRCTHGATIGQLDEEAVFYMKSRGIGAETARQMLVSAFAGGILNRISMEPVRAELERFFLEHLRRCSCSPSPH